MSANQDVDMEKCEEMSKLVEQLTTSGEPKLDEAKMKRLKKICRQSDGYVEQLFHKVMTQLDKNHCEIRLSALQIVCELFTRSHRFRELLLTDFSDFMDLTLGFDCPLPPPAKTAKLVKQLCQESIQKWQNQFGADYKKLSLAYNYLKTCNKVCFNDINARSLVERQREEEEQARLVAARKQRVEKAKQDLIDIASEIQDCIVQTDNCLQLLLPSPENFTLPEITTPDTPPIGMPSLSDADCKPDIIVKTEMKTCGRCGATLDEIKENENRKVCEKCENTEDKGIHGTTTDTSGNLCVDSVAENDPERVHPGNKDGVSDVCGRVKLEDISHTTPQNMTSPSHESESNTNVVNHAEEDVNTPEKTSLICLVSCSHSERDASVASHERDESNLHNTPGSATVKQPSDENLPSSELTGEEYRDDSDEFYEISTDEYESDDDGEMFSRSERQHGLVTRQYSLCIELNPDALMIQETEDNTDLLHVLKDSLHQITNKLLPTLSQCMEIFTKAGDQEENIKKALDLKQSLQQTHQQITGLKVSPMKRSNKTTTGGEKDDDDDLSDDDFEDVPTKEGLQDPIPDHLLEEYGLTKPVPRPATAKDWTIYKEKTVADKKKRRKCREDEEKDPTSVAATLAKMKAELYGRGDPQPGTSQQTMIPKVEPADDKKSVLEPQPGTSRQLAIPKAEPSEHKKRLLTKAPQVPYSMDLLYWGKDIEMPLVPRIEWDHRSWAPRDDDDTVDLPALASMKARVINFTGKFQPVKWKCLHPLPSGKLCERMDRHKCPFHGVIIARDAVGQPVNAKDAARLAEEEEKKQANAVPEWQDPELLADIKSATGVDLKRKAKGKGKTRKHPNLTDIKKVTSTSRTRLTSKVLSGKSLKRVAAAMDGIDAKKFKDKFGNTFMNTFGSK